MGKKKKEKRKRKKKKEEKEKRKRRRGRRRGRRRRRRKTFQLSKCSKFVASMTCNMHFVDLPYTTSR